MSLRTLYFFRHGLTDWNRQKRLQGHSDIPLNDEGREQARSLQSFFSQNPVEFVFSSDLSRAVETASLATGVHSDRIIKHHGFREAHLGVLEGLLESEIVAKHGEEALQNWRSLEATHKHFAFPGAESREQCNQRFHEALLKMCQQHSFKTAAVCSHGFVLRRLFHFISQETVIPPLIQNCVVFKVLFEENQQRFIFE